LDLHYNLRIALNQRESRARFVRKALTTFGFLAALILFVLIGLLSYFRIGKLATDNEWVIHTHQTIETLESLTLELTSLQSEVRGYVATGDPKYLAPYREHAQQIEIQSEKIRKLTTDNPRQQNRLERLSPLETTLLDLLQSEVNARSNLGELKAQSILLTGGGLETMNNVRNVVSEMMDEEQSLLQERENEVRHSSRSALQMIWIGGIVALFIVVGAAVQVNRELIHRERAQERIERLNNELELRAGELAEANRELEAFTYSVAHDLRAPLRHIDGFSSILQEDHEPILPDEARQHLSSIREGATKMGRLIDELLKLSRLGRKELTIERVELEPLIQRVIRSLEPETIDRLITWRVGDLRAVDCDPLLIEQVFANLLGNAVKYTGPRNPAIIEVRQTLADGQVLITVMDNGVGFDMKYCDKLFGVFQRLHRQDEFDGTGIGLATVQRIVQKHGGRVWAEAEIDKGATFSFTLPTQVRRTDGKL
jgi:signal transduction histidine kinase